jgi:DNA-binding PadR family transcriptional regulator
VVARSRRFFQHGELALVLLALLRRRPMHGYELLGELERLLAVEGYQPSPGSVYPALAALVSEGLVEALDQQGQRRQAYRLTRVGREALARRATAVAAFEVRTGVRLRADESLSSAVDRLRSRVLAVAEHVDPDAAIDILDTAAEAIEQAARGRDAEKGRRHA